MKVAFWCDSGSPMGITPPTVYGRGVGGAELSLINLAFALQRLGIEVDVYNDPERPGHYDNIHYRLKKDYRNNEDILIVFRVPTALVKSTNARKKIFWSCDQYTIGDYQKDIFPFVDKIVCISPHHLDNFLLKFNPQYHAKMTFIDLGVNTSDYDEAGMVERVTNRLLYCSSPDRGLDLVRAMWTKIKLFVPDAELYVTFDYRLWGAPRAYTEIYQQKWLNATDVHYLGAITRNELVKLQLSSDVHIYPCIYDELFCLAVAENQIAGCVPITSSVGAVKSTNEWGYQLEGNPKDGNWLTDYSDFVINSLTEDREKVLESVRAGMMIEAQKRFDWDVIARRWVELFNK